jgi:AhpD family alkylhydroperoxidase
MPARKSTPKTPRRAAAAAPTALAIRLPTRAELDPDMQKYFAVCDEKLGFLPNVLAAYSFDQAKLRAFANLYNDLMLADSELSKLEREMVAVVVSSANRCFYCLTAHGAAVRTAPVTKRQRAMLEFAHRLTVTPAEVGDEDRAGLRRAGLSDRAIWDLASVVGFFNFTNRLATAVDMRPNAEYHTQARG